MNKQILTRPVTPIEGFFAQSPFAVVAIAARVVGKIDEKKLTNAVEKLQERHVSLQYRLVQGADGALNFSNKDMKAVPIKVFARENNDDWKKNTQKLSKVPFSFDTTPAIKVVLVQSAEVCEVVILCHHLICDGVSLANLMEDLLMFLGDPTKKVEVLPETLPLSLGNMPDDVKQSRLVQFFIKRINQKWLDNKIEFDQADYEAITAVYWENYAHSISTISFTADETKTLVERCKREQVSVNSGLVAAFSAAPTNVVPEKQFNPRTVVAVNLRDKLGVPVDNGMGMFAGGVDFKFEHDGKKNFWENARDLHRKLKSLYTNKNIFKEVLTWSYLTPSINQAMNFKKIGGLVSETSPQFAKLSAFSKKEDVILSILKREGLDDFDNVFLGTAVTNLTRLNFSEHYGKLRLERIFIKPGGAFPLSNINLLIGVVTAVDKLTVTIEYSDERYSKDEMEKIKSYVTDKLIK